jgi:hypothetical protein
MSRCKLFSFVALGVLLLVRPMAADWVVFSQGPFKVQADLAEVLYFGADDDITTHRIKRLRLPVSKDPRADDFGPLIDDILRTAQTYFSGGDIFLSSSDILAGRSVRVKDYRFYEVIQGEKGVQSLGSSDLNATFLNALDIGHTYALRPLVPRYNCELVHLAHDGSWVLKADSGNKRISGISCSPKRSETWTVAIIVIEADQAGPSSVRYQRNEFKQRLEDAFYEKLESLPNSKLRSYRLNNQKARQRVQKLPPSAQGAFSDTLTFVVNVVVQ